MTKLIQYYNQAQYLWIEVTIEGMEWRCLIESKGGPINDIGGGSNIYEEKLQ